MKKKTVFVLTLLLSVSYVALANEVQVSASLDKNQVQIGEEVSYTIRILGARGNLQAPRLPSFEGFDSFYSGRTSHFTFMNGQSSATVEFSYVLVPKVSGRFSLEPVQIWIDGKTYSTPRLEIEVLGPQVQIVPLSGGSLPTRSTSPPSPAGTTGQAVPATQPFPSPPQLIHDDNVFVKAWVDKQTVFPNEQVLLTYTLYTRYDTRYEGFEEEPSVSGFWIEDFPLDRDFGRETVTMNGRHYVKADVRKIALFPTAPADYTIQPGTLKISIREEPKTTSLFDEFFGDSFFSGSAFFARRTERLLKPEPIVIQVKPFPETGKPKSFNGAVGQFRLTATVDKTEVKQNEPVTLQLVLEGGGNIETLARPPLPELKGFKIYDGDSSTQLFKSGLALGGKKTMEVIFIPTEAGSLSIPPLEFSFFEPRSQAYQVLRTQAFPLRVTPSEEPLRLPGELAQKEAYKKEILRETQDIRYLHEEWPSERILQIKRALYFGLLGGNLLGIFLVGNGLLRRRREAIFARDFGLKRRKLARVLALRRMKTLKGLARSKKDSEAERFLVEAEKVLNEYFSNKFNVSAYSFTRQWLEGKLVEILGPEDALLKQIRAFYDLAGEARFGRGTLPTQERHQFLELIDQVIRHMERLP